MTHFVPATAPIMARAYPDLFPGSIASRRYYATLSRLDCGRWRVETAPGNASIFNSPDLASAVTMAEEWYPSHRICLAPDLMVPQVAQLQQARHAPSPVMCRDYCAHVADFWGHRAHALAFGSDHRAYDQAWEAWCAYHARAKRGVRFGAWL